MKKILTAIAIICSLSAQAQNVKKDASNGLQYVNIDSVLWVRNKPKAQRLYVWGIYDNLSDMGRIHWQLRDSTYIDPETNNFNLVAEDNAIIDGEDYVLWDPESKYLFTFIARKLSLTIK